MKDVLVPMPLGDSPPTARLIYGTDVRDGLRLLEPDSVHCVVTSPPYWGLRDYGTDPSVWGGDPACEHEWEVSAVRRKHDPRVVEREDDEAPARGDRRLPRRKREDLPESEAFHVCARCDAWRGELGLEPEPDEYVDHLVEVFREVRRVLRPDGTMWLNIGDSYCSHGGPRAYGSHGGTTGTRATGRGRASPSNLPAKNLVGIPWRVALALQADGWVLRNAVVWAKQNHLPSPVKDRLTCSYEMIFLLTKEPSYHFDLDAIRVPHTSGTYDEDGAFTPQQNWYEKGEGHRKLDRTEGELGTMAGPPRRLGRGLYNPKGKNPSDVWSMPTQPFPGAHFAVFPEELPTRCIKAGSGTKACPVCGASWTNAGEPTCGCEGNDGSLRPTVLDPFSGSGTTGRVALRLDRHYIGIDRGEKYLEIAVPRVRGDSVPEPDPGPEEGSVLDVFGDED